MTDGRTCRGDLFVIGIGHPLRNDDKVGLDLVERLQQHFADGFNGTVAYEMDVGLAQELHQYKELLILDAAVPGSIAPPFKTVPMKAGEPWSFPGGFLTHIFDWSFLLGVTRDLYGSAPDTTLLAVAASDCGIGDTLSSECSNNADAAFNYLKDYCAA